MKNLLILGFATLLFSCNAENKATDQHSDNAQVQEEINDVDAQLKKDEAKSDSMKKALGID